MDEPKAAYATSSYRREPTVVNLTLRLEIDDNLRMVLIHFIDSRKLP
jgi:hypothetical protein